MEAGVTSEKNFQLIINQRGTREQNDPTYSDKNAH